MKPGNWREYDESDRLTAVCAEDRATLESDPSAARMAKWLGQR